MRILHKLINRVILAAAMSALISACAVGPDYVRSTVLVPESYKENKEWKVAEPRDDLFHGPWWEIFNDPKLNFLEEQVNISNQNIAMAEAQFRQATALVQTATSSFFPTITANPAVTRSLKSSNIGQGTSGTNTVYTAPLNISSWELDVWGRIRRTVEAARANTRASAADLEGVRLSVHAALAQNYFLLRALDRQKQLLDATVQAYQRSFELATNQYKSGVVSRADVLQAETQLKTIQAQAIDVGIQRAQAEHAIALLVGKPASDFSIPISPLDATPPPIPVGVPSELLERRPDIAGTERRVAAANAQIGAAKAAYFPTVMLTGSIGYQSTDTFNWFAWPSRFWSVGPAIAEALFDGGLRGALNDQARAVYDANVASYRQTVLIGFQEVEDNLAALRILEQEALAQDEAVKTARKSLEFFLNQYKQGTVSYLNVITAQVAALNSEKTAASILGRRMTASVLLIKALGGGWERKNQGAVGD
ncbi:MAG: efflux transporter outer membrane subunit [Proteobacteria bacterium]|nr:efflux transporter outer membrane subunit [Pseudomonadota bacterium]